MEEGEISKKIILAIDDDPMILDLYRSIFKTRGIEIRVVEDGKEGLKLIMRDRPDFVILDIRMPRMNGVEVLKRIRGDESSKDIPVLVLTNLNVAKYRDEMEALGIVDFLTKADVEPKDVVDLVIGFLSKKVA